MMGTLFKAENLEELTKSVVRSIAELLEAEDCSLFLVNKATNKLDMQASTTLPEANFDRGDTGREIAEKPRIGLIPYVAATKQTLNFLGDEYQRHIAWNGTKLIGRYYLPSQRCKSLLIVPFSDSAGKILGVIKVENKRGSHESRGFLNDEKILLTLASATAIAIENSNLWTQLKNQLRNLSHATITPLAAIRLHVENLWLSSDEERRKTSYGLIKQQLVELNQMFKNILNYLKSEGKQLQPHTQSIDCGRLISEVRDLYQLEATSTGIKLLLPDNPPSLSIVTDPDLLKQALANLIKNALQAFPQNHNREREVKMSLVKSNKVVSISVSDTGKGISETQLQTIFKPFYSETKGTGIGLAITKTIVELLEGQILLESRVNSGSNFTIVLPAKE